MPRDGEAEGTERRGRVLVIDSDAELGGILAQLLEEDGLEVSRLACEGDPCQCVEQVLASGPDVVVINVAHPQGQGANLHGWACLQRLEADAGTGRVRVLGYSIFDAYSLLEMGLDLHAYPNRIVADITNPGQFTDAVSRSLARPHAA